jgi:hypothetical protein
METSIRFSRGYEKGSSLTEELELDLYELELALYYRLRHKIHTRKNQSVAERN